MSKNMPSALTAIAASIGASFAAYRRDFAALTAAARLHFEQGAWVQGQRDAKRRLELYQSAVVRALEVLPLEPAERQDRELWTRLRVVFGETLGGRDDGELAETFFNSVTRRLLGTVGVDHDVEFVGVAPPATVISPDTTVRFSRKPNAELDQLIQELLAGFSFAIPYEDLQGDAARIARRLRADLPGEDVVSIEMVRAPFFRGKGCYLMGRLETARGTVEPFVLALTNPLGRIVVDALLVDTDDVSILFSFARAYFAVATDKPRELIAFLRALMPKKPLYELYNAIGFNKLGKTAFYGTLMQHLEDTRELFVVAPGQRGMVMCVFVLPGLDVVFKVVRDRFAYPKTVSHREVHAKYRLVTTHDRAGRLADAQPYGYLTFPKARFSAPVLDELLDRAADSVRLDGERVVISQLYTERRLRPLDLYLSEAPPDAARAALIDYGWALKELAANNVFPGDLLLKNFGVSRHGRVIFYDYDEICLLSDCNFRRMPVARTLEDEMSAEPWYYVGERDIFPEELWRFLGLPADQLDVLLAHHGDLFTADFWQRMQAAHAEGQLPDIYPYPEARRLRLS
jgi:isocitrate dehydrogenase kinase/phosphatase